MNSFLAEHDILTLYCVIDDAVKELQPVKTKVGRPPVFSDSEMITILAYNTLLLHQKNLKDILKFMEKYHKRDFKKFPRYSAFVDHVHRVLPIMTEILSSTLVKSEIDFVDSTMLEVCTLKRAENHKVAKNVAKFGKNHQGWHYGFKFHAAITSAGMLSSVCFSPANIYDAQMLPKLIKRHMRIAIGDSQYGASVMRKYIWETYKTIIITPPHWKQKTKIATMRQNTLISMRSKIESTFDILKQHFHLVTSFPRSVKGYFVHYVRILLAYQFSMLLKYAN